MRYVEWANYQAAGILFSALCYIIYFVCVPPDINECSTSSDNDCDQLCVNTLGGYTCDCRDGYLLDMNERTCNGKDMTYVCSVLICNCERTYYFF